MKVCKYCSERKELSEFYTNGKCGHHPVCKSCTKEKAKRERLLNPDKFRVAEKKKYEKNKAAYAERMASYYEKNREKKLEAEKKRYSENAEKIKSNAAAYRACNKDKVYEWNGSRRAQLRNAVPQWADKSKIREIYACARRMTAETGVMHHVDHIVPLSGSNVCGLHVDNNLTVITGAENMRKSNRFYE